MDIDKSLNQAPLGLDFETPEMDEGPDIEIEIEGDVDVEVEIEEEQESDFNDNLAEDLDEGVLTELAGDLLGEFDEDISSRKDWIQTYVDGLELLGMKVEDRTEPWPGACGVHHPLLAEAVVKFQAETMSETFPAQGPVRTQIIGKETTEKKDAAAARPRRHELPVD
jgi:hypothetical protein